jgi:hypothetical protein
MAQERDQGSRAGEGARPTWLKNSVAQDISERRAL